MYGEQSFSLAASNTPAYSSHSPPAFLQDQLTVAQAAVQSELDALNQGLQKRQQAAKVKALLELMQDTAHVMSKVRACLSAHH